NIIVFGETGVGKSSVINMVAGRHIAETSNSFFPCTLEPQQHVVYTPDVTLNLFNTPSPSHDSPDISGYTDTIVALYKLVHNMKDGVNLLIHVIRPQPTGGLEYTRLYRMFYKIFCEKKVPVVLITHLDYEEHPEDWWYSNYSTFRGHGMDYAGEVCVAANKKERDSVKVVKLITSQWSSVPFKMERVEKSLAVLMRIFNGVVSIIPGIKPVVLGRTLYCTLWEYGWIL
ncbi:hypothetical protein JAAARDRAFT_126885, partial [Jaapia argillacea MUCL 33604]